MYVLLIILYNVRVGNYTLNVVRVVNYTLHAMFVLLIIL